MLLRHFTKSTDRWFKSKRRNKRQSSYFHSCPLPMSASKMEVQWMLPLLLLLSQRVDIMISPEVSEELLFRQFSSNRGCLNHSECTVYRVIYRKSFSLVTILRIWIWEFKVTWANSNTGTFPVCALLLNYHLLTFFKFHHARRFGQYVCRPRLLLSVNV